MTRPDQTRPDHPVVSFCIPVYNNAQAALTIVKALLVSDDSRFEVIVSDDNSREDVEGALSEIHDSRFRYYRNTKNFGAHKNWEHALELGRGEWLYLVMGRDMLYGERVQKLIEILEYARENGITYLKDGGFNGRNDITVYNHIAAMTKFVAVEHPSGDIYNGDIFRNIPNRTTYYEIADTYPECYIKHYLLLNGKGAFINSGVFVAYEKRLNNGGKIKSGVESGGNIFDAYYAPHRATIQFFERIDLIDGDYPEIFTHIEIDRYFRINLNDTLRRVSEHWRNLCLNQSWLLHYGHQVRHVSMCEMIGNILTACKDTRLHLKEKGNFSAKRQMIMYYCAVRAIIKCVVYYPVKRNAKKILESIGIWAVIKGIRKNPRP